MSANLENSLVAWTVKNLPAMQETWVQFPGQEDPLEKGMATHSTILAWVIPRTGEPGGGCRVGDDSVTNTFTFWTRQFTYIIFIYFSQKFYELGIIFNFPSIF